MHIGSTQAPMGFVFSLSIHFSNTIFFFKRPGVAKLPMYRVYRQFLSWVCKRVTCRRHGSSLGDAIVLIFKSCMPLCKDGSIRGHSFIWISQRMQALCPLPSVFGKPFLESLGPFHILCILSCKCSSSLGTWKVPCCSSDYVQCELGRPEFLLVCSSV